MGNLGLDALIPYTLVKKRSLFLIGKVNKKPVITYIMIINGGLADHENKVK